MKRLLFIAVIWGAALLPPAAQAQRGMGFRGSSAPPARGHSGFAGRPVGVPSAGFASRPTGFAGRSGPTFSFARPGMPRTGGQFVSPRSHVFVSGHRTFVSGHHRTFVSGHRAFFPHNFRHFHHFRNNPFFFPNSCFNGFFDPFCNNGFFFGSSFIGPFDPFFSDFPNTVAQQQPALVEDSGNSGELALQMQELSDEVQSLRDEARAREERRSAPTKPAVQDLSPDTIFVFRDGLQLSARNYAIAGETLWVLDEHKARKVPLSKIDIPATEQANAKNGVEIRLPK